jgi:hypothetical protein
VQKNECIEGVTRGTNATVQIEGSLPVLFEYLFRLSFGLLRFLYCKFVV